MTGTTDRPTDEGQNSSGARGRGVSQWLRVGGDRRLVAAITTIGIGWSFILLAAVSPTPLGTQLLTGDMIDTLFGAMITAIVTGTTLVVTIGQLVLTQENGPLGDQRERLSNSMAVRESVADITGETPPTDPALFLDAILQAVGRRAESLRETLDEPDAGTARASLRDLTTRITAEVTPVRDRLDAASFGSFNVLSAALAFEYGPLLRDARSLEREGDLDLDASATEDLDGLRQSLSLFGPAREHVKTLYFQWALIDLSRQILFAAVPAVVIAGLMIAVIEPMTVTGSVLGIDMVTLLVGWAFALTLVPFVLFVVTMLRILTVAKRTLAIEPLVLQDDNR